jgi:hypothetical protein
LGDFFPKQNAPEDRKIRPNGDIAPNLVTLARRFRGFIHFLCLFLRFRVFHLEILIKTGRRQSIFRRGKGRNRNKKNRIWQKNILFSFRQWEADFVITT